MDTEIRDIYVISDLHLGDFSNRDSFAKTPLKTKEGIAVDRISQFRAFLDMVRKNNGFIVILGDLFEFWKASIGTVLSKNIDLLGELASFGDLTIILGSHDNDLADFISNPSLRLQESHPFFAKIQIGNYTDGASDYTIMQTVFIPISLASFRYKLLLYSSFPEDGSCRSDLFLLILSTPLRLSRLASAGRMRV